MGQRIFSVNQTSVFYHISTWREYHRPFTFSTYRTTSTPNQTKRPITSIVIGRKALTSTMFIQQIKVPRCVTWSHQVASANILTIRTDLSFIRVFTQQSGVECTGVGWSSGPAQSSTVKNIEFSALLLLPSIKSVYIQKLVIWRKSQVLVINACNFMLLFRLSITMCAEVGWVKIGSNIVKKKILSTYCFVSYVKCFSGCSLAKPVEFFSVLWLCHVQKLN